MSENPVQPWIAVNNYMQDEYRETVANLALQHFPDASRDLRAFVKRELSRTVKIDGYRSFDRAPAEVVQRHVVRQMEYKPGVITAIICLWAEAEQESIGELQAVAEARGLQFRSDWSWQKAKEGFYNYEVVAPLTECIEILTQDRPSPESDHIWLATLWLSRALISEPSERATESSFLQPQETLTREDESTPTEVESPSLEEEKPDTTRSADLSESEETLQVLTQSLQERVDEIDQARQVAISKARTVLAATEAPDLAEAEAQLVTLQSALAGWRSERSSLEKIARRAGARLTNELEVRSDLDIDVPASTLLSEEEPADIVIKAAAKALLRGFEHILEYDHEKKDILSRLDQVRARIVELREDIVGWMQDESLDIEGPLYPEGDEHELTLTDAQAILEQATAQQHKLENRRSQLRELSLNRIATLIDRLQELGLAADAIVSDGLALGELDPSNIAGWASGRLWSLEQTLVELVNEQMMRARSIVPETLVAELKSDWDDDKLIDLLNRLAEEKRDVEALLLLLAANAAHPRTQTVGLARPVVSSSLRGIGQLSKKTHPFELLNSLALDFLNGWEATDQESQAELCLVFLAAQYSGGRRLPNGFLWQLPNEWPVSEMESWSKLWQSALLDESLPAITSTQDNDWADRLEQARSHAEQMFAREHGIFARLSSLKSGRHATLLRSEIMPDLLSRLVTLQEMEEKLRLSEQNALPHLLTQLEQLLSGDLPEALHEEALIEAYEAGVTGAGIVDHDPFHRRTALRVIQECGESILDYGQALVEFWRMKLQREASVTQEALQAELAALPELTPLGQAALDQIVRAIGSELPEWDEAIARSLASQQLVHELLSQATYALRLPGVVGYLTGARLDWMELLRHVLDNLAGPVDAASVATLLMEQEAPNQVLLLTQYVSLGIQKQAQSLKRDKGQEIDGLQTDLLKAGGSAEDLLSDRELGRWRLVHQELAQRLDKQRAVHRAKERRVREKALQLRRTIHELDMSIFEFKETMPADVYRLVEQGLNAAKRATETEMLFDQVEAYLQEIRYRLEHQSWPLTELQNATVQLERVVEKPEGNGARKAEEVLDLLERGELRQLDLNPNDVATSEVRTRCELLRNWLAARALPTLMSEDLKIADRTAIQTLFRYFAQMVAMKRWRGGDGKPIVYEYPFIYSYWGLQYPKTTALDGRCILIALPGNPPAARDLSQLQYHIEDKGWLEYAFVFLFVPGCTPAIHNRLHSHYQNKGLVIIDESALLDMVLAETESNNPLGRLRPLMLNALGPEHVDVFKINQLVDSRTAIFVGRDALVDRIVSSGDNYALYGGRRIGKSSVLKAIEERLKQRGVNVVSHSFEGDTDCSDDASAVRLAQHLKLESEVQDVGDFKLALQAGLDATPDSNLVLLLDEIDRYIIDNPTRHVLIEALRVLSEQYGSRFRVVVAGFMSLYDCLQGRGPYTPASDPWQRMLNDIGPLPNLPPVSAEQIAREGFIGILGWKFENRAIPQRIVEHTGGHPAFVQHFCMKLQQRTGRRGDWLILLEDIEAIFADRDPDQSFVAYVRETLKMNLDPVGRYLILWLAAESSEARGFTLDQMRELASLRSQIPEEHLSRSLQRLSVTSVVKERTPQVYEFSVPDYPLILNQLGETAHLERLESELEEYLKGQSDVNI